MRIYCFGINLIFTSVIISAGMVGLRAMMMELGFGPELQVVHMATDSSVAKSVVSTRGLGKMMHLDVKLFCGSRNVCRRVF